MQCFAKQSFIERKYLIRNCICNFSQITNYLTEHRNRAHRIFRKNKFLVSTRKGVLTALRFQPRVECLYWVCGAGSAQQRACAASAGVSAGLTVVDVGASGRWDRFACSPPFHTPSSCSFVARVHACEELLCSCQKWHYPQVGATINSRGSGEVSWIIWSEKIRRGWRLTTLIVSVRSFSFSFSLSPCLSFSFALEGNDIARARWYRYREAGEPPAFLSSPLAVDRNIQAR